MCRGNDVKNGRFFPLFTFHRSLCSAFTLAEILTVLGIIGVLAAMTIPNLISAYQKTQTVVQIKKFYTNMNQALQFAIKENGDFSTWSYSTTDELYDNYLAENLKTIEVKRNIQIWGDFIGGVFFVFSDGTSAVCSTWSNFTGSVTCVFQTKKASWGTYATNMLNPTRETFYFVINNKGVLVPPDLTNTRANNLASCKWAWNGTSNGHVECSTVIIKDGWEIKDDYPW